MKRGIEHEKLIQSKQLNLFLGLGFLTMLFVSAALSIGLAYAVMHQSRTLVPPSLSGAFTVSDGQVDAAYLTLMGEYFLYLKLNVTPTNVSRQFGRLLEYVPSSHWSSIQQSLTQEAETVKNSGITSYFSPQPNGSAVSITDLQYRLTGDLTKTVGSRSLPAETYTYTVQMQYKNGVIGLVGIAKAEVKP
ncbi:hypothetical protein TUMSATVNIG1_58320 (plasmid) [Vibrio nigripulchritudo]|uniref:Type IV conjugative transfer system protein TraE n=1 Tax=Vibrio nigripulchritudo SOn1 TaxID=1238450 RepID=A0AAV2W055_9VIBR|nr:type IV conjugative transfer system protein TraE [Vibrio nigripulchritudo]BCL73847.1 hypothetical protein VNTUMSATTG_57840 [Vibrio nigripulchritudo]BDU35223.1 hypothetical protein TUMSATVNIG1_58320 [Vibrio nigripulchritudo]CCO50273.1 Type IV conjugative transfer system protein TraE [Vibrio nigripulchritudo SOn1]